MPITRLAVALFIGIATGTSPVWADDQPTPIEPESVSLGRPVDFAADIAPFLDANCVACHNVAIDEGSLSLEDLAGMLKGGDRGPAIVPGKPNESLLLAVAAHRREPVMPPLENDVEAKPLTPRELGLLRQWILEGATTGGGTTGPMIAWRPLPMSYRAIHGLALSPEARFAAVGRGGQLEVYDLALAESSGRLIDPNLSSLVGDGGPLYLEGAADRDLIQAVAFSPDGMMIAAGGYRAVKLWRRAGLDETPVAGLGGVTSFAVSPDRDSLVAAVGNEARLLNAADGSIAKDWAVPSPVSHLSFSSDGQAIAAVEADRSLRVWNLSEAMPGSPKTLPSPATSIAAIEGKIVTAHEDGILCVWSDGDQPERVLQGHDGPVRTVISVPNRPNFVVSGSADGTVRIWDTTLDGAQRSLPHGGSVAGVAISPDGVLIASCGSDGSVRFWNFEDGAKLGEFTGLISRRRGERRAAERLEWRRQLGAAAEARRKQREEAVRDREENLKKAVEAKAAAEKAAAEAAQAAVAAKDGAEAAIALAAASPEDAAIKASADEATKKRDEAAKKASDADEAMNSAMRDIGLAEESLKTVRAQLEARIREKQSADEAASAAEQAAQVAKAEAEQPVEALSIAFAPDGRRVVVGYAGGVLQSFSRSGRPMDSIVGSDGAISGVQFASDSEVLASAGDGTIRRIDVAGRWEYAGALGPPHDSPLDLSRSKFADRILALAFSPDGRTLAVGGGEPSRSGELSVWEIASRSRVREFTDAHSDTVQAVAFSEDGRIVASGAADKFAKAFDLESGALLASFEGHTDHVLGVTLKKDRTELVTAAADTAVKVWDVETGEQRRTIAGHGKQVTAIRHIGLTGEIVTACGDHGVRLYRTADGGHVKSFGGPTDYVHALDASRDGATVAAGGEDGVLYVWDVATGAVSHRFDPPATETASK